MLRRWIWVCMLAGCGGSKAPADTAPDTPEAVPAPAPPAEPAPPPEVSDPEPGEPAPNVGPPTGPEGRCGGIAGFKCADGLTCVDDPTDGCEPGAGSADCMGICVPPPTGAVAECPDTETKRYVATTEMCKRIRYRCADGEVPFGDACGCGCEISTAK